MHIRRGRNSIGEMHILRGRRHHFNEKTLFLFVLLYAYFLVAIWWLKLHLVSMLCRSYRIVLFLLHVRMIICFAM